MGDTVFCTSLAGDELARLHTWGTHPQRLADYTLASPCIHYDLPQDIFEPIILGEAARRGSRVRFDTEYLSHVQDADGVTVTVQDRIGGEVYEIRAKYLIGADGGRSKIAQDIGLPMEGEMDWAGSMNIVFHADLSKYVAHRPSVLYWIMQPGADMGGIGMGLVRMVRPWDEWLIVWGYDINEPPPRSTRRSPRASCTTSWATTRSTSRCAAPRCGATTRCTPSATSRVASTAWATPATGTRRATAWARTPRSPTRTTWRGSSRWCSTARRRRRCWTPTTPSARRSASRSCCARTRVDRGVRADLRRARPARHVDPEQMRANMEIRKENSRARRRGARQAQGRDRAQELRVQRARRRARAPLPLRRGGRRTARPSRSSRATRSSTTTRRRGRARGCRTRGSSTAASGSRRTTSPARGASRSSPGSAARAGWRPRRRSSAAHRRADRRRT